MEHTPIKPEAQAAAPAVPDSPAPKWAPGRKKGWKKRWLILVIALAALFFFVVRPLLSGGGAAAALAYTPAAVQARDLGVTVSGSGTVTPADSYKVTTLVNGEVAEAPFEVGDRVEKGDLLYRIDPGSAQTALQQAQLSVAQAQLAYDAAAGALRPKASGAGVIEKVYVKAGDMVAAGSPIADVSDTSVMTLTLPFQSADAARIAPGQAAAVTLAGTFETLAGTVEYVAPADQVGAGGALVRQVKLRVDNPGALTAAASATAKVGELACAASGTFEPRLSQTVTAETGGEVVSLNVAQGSRVSGGTVLAVLGGSAADTSLQNAALALENAQLSLQTAQDALDNYTITAPISGTVIEKKFKAGDTIDSDSLTAAQGALAVIYDMSALTFDMSINELDINKVAVGQIVDVTASALDGVSFRGAVDTVNINGTTTNNFTSYPITVRLEGDGSQLSQQGLKPGMNVSAKIHGPSVSGALCVPVGAVSRGNTVLVAQEGALSPDKTQVIDPSKAEERPVTLGLNDDAYIQILSGLSEGDVVLVPGQTDGLTGGMDGSGMTEMGG